MLLDKLYRKFWDKIDKSDADRVAKEVLPEGIELIENIPYVPGGNKWQVIDVIRPEKREGPLPVIIDVHGGGLQGGTKYGNRPYCYCLASYGFIVFAMDYSLSPEYRYPAHLEDVNESLLWIKDHLEEYGGDEKNVFITGDSAGGLLAIHETLVNNDIDLAASYGLVQPGFSFNAVALTSGIFEFDKSAMIKILFPGIFGTWSKKKASHYKDLDLSGLIRKETVPPCFLVTSKEDFIRGATVRFAELLKSKDIPYILYDYPRCAEQKLPHVFSVLQPSSVKGRDCIEKMIAFFKERMK